MSVNPGPIPLRLRAQRKAISHLAGVGATSADTAVSYIPRRRFERQALAYLQRKGVVTLADGGRYWVDQAKAADLRSATRTRIVMIAGGALAAAAAAFAFTR